MASKSKVTRIIQKELLEKKLAERVALLTGRGKDSSAIDKDGVVRMLKAKIRKNKARLTAIAAMTQKIEEKTKSKAAKLAAPRMEKIKEKTAEEAEEEPAESKRQQKKKQKKEQKESKAAEQ